MHPLHDVKTGSLPSCKMPVLQNTAERQSLIHPKMPLQPGLPGLAVQFAPLHMRKLNTRPHGVGHCPFQEGANVVELTLVANLVQQLPVRGRLRRQASPQQWIGFCTMRETISSEVCSSIAPAHNGEWLLGHHATHDTLCSCTQ